MKQCRRCERDFAPKRKDQVYCTDTCREEDYAEKYGTKPVTKTCKNCGETFETTKPKKQDYCKPDCRREARAKRMSEAEARQKAEKQTYMEEITATLERDGYRCTRCGGTINLRVISSGPALTTVCTSCLKSGEKS